MKKKTLSVIILLFVFNAGFAQRYLSTDVWHEGFVILEKGDTLKGILKYNLETGVVQFSRQEREKGDAYTAKNIYYFQIYDKIQERTRRFYSLPFSENYSGFETLKLFEVLVEGKMNLLAREKRVIVNKSDYYWGIYYTYGEEILQMQYFILLENREIQEFKGNQKSFLLLCGSKSSVMKKYIKEKGLRTKNKSDLVKMVGYFNALE